MRYLGCSRSDHAASASTPPPSSSPPSSASEHAPHNCVPLSTAASIWPCASQADRSNAAV
jgi:hypothetical protein